MSLTRTKVRRRLKTADKCISDVTLNDFANSDKAGNSEGFRKKIGFKTLIEDVKSLTLSCEMDTPVENDEDSRDEKENCKRRRRKSREVTEGEAPKEEEEEQLQSATAYPLDMWFLIGEYIPPEDVGRFAAICSSTRAVVASPDFWLRLRRRYITGGRRESEKNNYALRAQVIRALRQSYAPLLVRPQFYFRPAIQKNCWSLIAHSRVLRYTGDHHLVLGACCIQSWQEKRKGGWVFYIKLKHPNRTSDVYSASNPEPTESLKCQEEGTPDCWMSRESVMGEETLGTEHYDKGLIGDIWFNSEEGCKIIEVMLGKEHQSNGHFGPCPQILGLSLMWASARQTSTTTASSISRRLDLLFGPPHLTPKAASSLLPRQSVGWESCGGGWAEPVSEAEEIALACGTSLPKGARCGVNRQSCCRGGSRVGSAGMVKGLAYPEGIVPVHLPSVQGVRLLDWWDVDYPYPGEVMKRTSDFDDEDNLSWGS